MSGLITIKQMYCPNEAACQKNNRPLTTRLLTCRWIGLSVLVLTLGCGPKPEESPSVPEDSNTTRAPKAVSAESLPEIASETLPVATTTNEPVIAHDPLDWLNWRGPNFNGVSGETGLIDDFDPKGGPESNVAWSRDDLGGRSTPVVMNGKLYTLCRAEPGTRREGERVVCVDAATGETIWENRFNVYLSDVPDTRVGWSAVVADPETGTVFALGVCGLFQCIDAETGETKWSLPMHEQFGLLSTYGGRTNFPLICDDLVLVSSVVINWGERAKPADSYVAFDKRTGDVVWFAGTRIGPEDTTYSSAALSVLNGQKSLVFGSGDGSYWSFQPRTGRPIWRADLSRRGINTPAMIDGDRVFMAHSEENVVGTAMGTVMSLNTASVGDVAPATSFATTKDIVDAGVQWRVDELMCGRSQPLLVGNRLWVFDDRAKLWILDAETGEQVGKRFALGRMMHASPLYADGKVYAFEANGRWAIYRPDDQDGAVVVSDGRFSSDQEIQGSPIVSHGRMYLQTSGALYCFVDPNKTPGYEPLPAPREELPLQGHNSPDHVQVIPAEVLLRPGQKQAFTVRMFNARGQQVKAEGTAEFRVEGPATIAENGQLTASPDAAHEAVTVFAKVGELEGSARVRIVPDLPWHFDFDGGQVPVTFVGARYRHVVLDDTLLQTLKDEAPMAAQLYIYLHSSLRNSGRPALAFDNSTPEQRWTQFQRFLGIKTTSMEEARSMVDPALQKLVDVGVLSDRTWEEVPEVGPKLTVKQGARQLDGNGVMTKITTIPKGTRSRCWFGHSDLHDYTIQADVRGASRDGKMPDIGVLAQGYTLDLQGEHQKLEIRTWDPQLRMAQSVPFPWQADRWYTIKLRASVEDGKAVLRGKAWPRDEDEPQDWTVVATDESPVTAGSPGLFGNAKDAEIFLDNIHVTPN
jgi:outer membrane protein assembly factor BamB